MSDPRPDGDSGLHVRKRLRQLDDAAFAEVVERHLRTPHPDAPCDFRVALYDEINRRAPTTKTTRKLERLRSVHGWTEPSNYRGITGLSFTFRRPIGVSEWESLEIPLTKA